MGPFFQRLEQTIKVDGLTVSHFVQISFESLILLNGNYISISYYFEFIIGFVVSKEIK